ncbi:hypothetical protein ASD79_09020 [Caulobacter sp. Root655]|uniref:hypothetical protein n=1 Tax=Caulobacter sp. Root655 TaxID=1736578 RepID=UPI0006F6E5A6|nr:hypothetical protein [Caulobacter sp. Root655]KRA60366.1 hypothetical protein ASD79_09020 [Caulobacter sp. Root655]
MMSRRGLLWLSTGLAMLGLAGCETVGVYRFRLTVEIDTPRGVRDGSSVMQVRYGVSYNINGGGQQADVDLDGEAVFVDLGDGRHVIAVLGHPLLRSGAYEQRFLPADAFFPDYSSLRQIRALKASGKKLQGAADLAVEQIPSLATFERPADPTSARVVYGRAIRMVADGAGERETRVHIDEIAEVFGAGYALRRVRLEIVPENTPITRQIKQRLPWLNDPNVMKNPGWALLPELSRIVINLLVSK